ncbi:MAG: DUF1054 family protein [Armatimonadetes bacterium]|nr:DUF1054 family protein [Armatimonadota bacterium]
MSFEGFHAEDFEIFEMEGFAERMGALRQCVKPKLVTLGEALVVPLSKTLGETLYPHVAQHLRRTVNPPVETWVAFAREKRAYKPFVHVRATIREECVRVLVFVEDYADEKEAFANHIMANAATLSELFAKHPEILAYDIHDVDSEPLRGSTLTPEVLTAFAERLRRVKGQHAIFGIPIPKAKVSKMGSGLPERVVKSVKILKPLYCL